MKAYALPASLLLVLFATIAPSASATNLVTNPSFAGDTSGWQVDTNTTFDAANDATGTAGSGSAKSTFNSTQASTLLSLSQCIAAGPGNYTLGGKVLIPDNQAIGGAGLVTVSYFSGADCVTGYLNNDVLLTSTTGSFQTLSGPITAPATTAHIWITGQNVASGAGTHIVNFDDFVLDNAPAQPAPTPALDRLGLLSLIAAFAAIGLFFANRRRRTVESS